MKKMVTVCGQGLGSSLIVEMNVKQVLSELGIENEFDVTHENLNTYSPENYDFVICGEDIAPSIVVTSGKKIVLKNIMDTSELKQKIEEAIK